jgi:short-subunit dehydrogenase
MDWGKERVLVIGASGGIGDALAKALFKRGARVFGTYRNNPPSWNQWKEDTLFPLDFEDSLSSIQSKISHILSSAQISTVIIAAGSAYYGGFGNMNLNDLHHTFQVDLLAPVAISQSAINHFQSSGGGHLHIVSAIAGIMPAVKNMTVYTSAKFGLVGFAKALAMECVGTPIKVSVSCPAGVLTNLPQNSLGERDGFLKIIEILKKNFETPDLVAEGILDGWGEREVVQLPTEKAKSLAKQIKLPGA